MVFVSYLIMFFFFFFQAEDGIRDLYVTGVQTCALPIFAVLAGVSVERTHRGDALRRRPLGGVDHDQLFHQRIVDRLTAVGRSEERRVGKECRSRWWRGH